MEMGGTERPLCLLAAHVGVTGSHGVASTVHDSQAAFASLKPLSASVSLRSSSSNDDADASAQVDKYLLSSRRGINVAAESARALQQNGTSQPTAQRNPHRRRSREASHCAKPLASRRRFIFELVQDDECDDKLEPPGASFKEESADASCLCSLRGQLLTMLCCVLFLAYVFATNALSHQPKPLRNTTRADRPSLPGVKQAPTSIESTAPAPPEPWLPPSVLQSPSSELTSFLPMSHAPTTLEAVARINADFRDGRRGDDPKAVGIIMHQWDGAADFDSGKLWRMCVHDCFQQTGWGKRITNGRVSASIIFQRMREHPLRHGIRIATMFGGQSGRGGILFDPQLAPIDCMFQGDGGTIDYDDPSHPGCPPQNMFCRQSTYVPITPAGSNPRCAFAADELAEVLDHFEHEGAHWPHQDNDPTKMLTGPNEVVLNSNRLNQLLPHSIQAFFVFKGMGRITWLAEGREGQAIPVDTVNIHKRFLKEYQLSDAEVPLVEFDPNDWEEPFSLFSLPGAPASA